jgi:hypothetical protein
MSDFTEIILNIDSLIIKLEESNDKIAEENKRLNYKIDHLRDLYNDYSNNYNQNNRLKKEYKILIDKCNNINNINNITL